MRAASPCAACWSSDAGLGDERVLEFVRRAYEFSLTQGIARLGWINCWPVLQEPG
jgi:hypothetical protein